MIVEQTPMAVPEALGLSSAQSHEEWGPKIGQATKPEDAS
jgi:hypothetical protein